MNIDNHVRAFGECDERVMHVDVALDLYLLWIIAREAQGWRELMKQNPLSCMRFTNIRGYAQPRKNPLNLSRKM
jgi:hypothetical protein